MYTFVYTGAKKRPRRCCASNRRRPRNWTSGYVAATKLIDQLFSVETIRATYHDQPYYSVRRYLLERTNECREINQFSEKLSSAIVFDSSTFNNDYEIGNV